MIDPPGETFGTPTWESHPIGLRPAYQQYHGTGTRNRAQSNPVVGCPGNFKPFIDPSRITASDGQ